MTINKTAFIGELLISSGVLNEEERKLGVQRERENVSKHFRSEPVLKNFPDPAEKAAFEAKCDAFTKACESDPDCKLTISELARSVKIEEKYLLEGPRFTNALKELIGESKITSMTLDEFKTVCELLNAMQAIGRAEGIIGTFTTKDKLHDSIPKDKLEAIQATYSSSPEVKLDALPNNEPWIKSPIQVTRESQAVTSILKCFVTASAQAMDMDKNLYRVPAMEKAVKAAAALQHLLKKELLEELKKTGKGGAAIDLLTEELKLVDFSKIAEKRNVLCSVLCQGLYFIAKTVGLQSLGQKIESMAYKSDSASYVESIVQGTRLAMKATVDPDSRSNSGEPIWYDNAIKWLKDRTVLAGVGKHAADKLFATEPTRARS